MTTAARPTRLDSLTSLRAFAAVSVFFFHTLGLLKPADQAAGGTAMDVVVHLILQGNVGVSFFFILSGFVLTWSHRDGDPAQAFWVRRFARVYPNHLVTWGLAAVLMVLALTPASTVRSGVANLFLVNTFVGGSTWLVMNAPSWSLEAEQLFYVLFPFVLPHLTRIRSAARWRSVWITIGIVSLPAIALTLTSNDTEELMLAFQFFPLFRVPEFVIGMLLGLLARKPGLPTVPRGLAWAIVGVGYVACGFAPELLRNNTIMLGPFTLLIVAVAKADMDGRPSVLNHRALVRLGAWSYAFYCVHHLFVVVAEHRFADDRVGLPTYFAASAVLLSLAWLGAAALHHGVEVPAERWIRRRLSQPAAVG